MQKVKTIEGFLVEISNEPLENGKPYVFKHTEDGDWWYGEIWRGDMIDAGGRPILETINPNVIRKKVIRILDKNS